VSSAEEMARGLEAAAVELEEFVTSCAEKDWLRLVPIESRTVGVMAYHCAAGMEILAGWLDIREGEPVSGTAAETDEANAREALAKANVGPAEVLALLHARTPPATAAIRALSPAQMSSTVAFGPADGAELGVDLLAGAGERHIRRHLAHIREALEDPG
jgi:hypothetical protein